MARIGGGGRGYSANVFFYNVLLFAREGSILSVHCACILYRWWEEDIWWKIFRPFLEASKTRGYSIFKNNFMFGSNNDDSIMYKIRRIENVK